jgi:hypothetical protein
MVDLGQIFDPSEIPEDSRGGFEPLPAGEILKLTLEVLDGPYERRRIFENLNIRNANPVAQGIAQRALADLCKSCGLEIIRDSEELHFRPFVAKVAIETDKTGQYEPKNRVKRYKPARSAPPVGKAVPVPVQPISQPQAKPSRPWGRPAA